jgi:hypothetical protein
MVSLQHRLAIRRTTASISFNDHASSSNATAVTTDAMKISA